MKTVIICHTPLHCLLSSAISRDCPNVVLVFISDSDINLKFLDEIGAMISAKVFIRPGSYQAKGVLSRFWRRTRNIHFFKRRKIFDNVSRLITFNDVAVEDQFAFHQAKLFGAEVWLGEDGVAIYETGGGFYESPAVQLMASLFYGRWWHPKERIGTDSAIAKIYASFPSMVVDHVARGKALYPLAHFDRADYTLLARYCGWKDSKSDTTALIILPTLSQAVVSFVKLTCNDLVHNGYHVLVKFHPREVGTSIINVERELPDSISIVPKNIPCELLCMTENPPDLVVGFRSSALHLIKAMVPSANVRYWETGSGNASMKWKEFYRKVKVEEYRPNKTENII